MSFNGIRISRLYIKNYKKIDELEIEFPAPLMTGDADIFVLGSKNGGGKTSVLECCSLLLFFGVLIKDIELVEDIGQKYNLGNWLIRAGCYESIIEGDFELQDEKSSISLNIQQNGHITSKLSSGPHLVSCFNRFIHEEFYKKGLPDTAVILLNSILSFSEEPMLTRSILHFNSYRKVSKENPEMGMMTNNSSLKGSRNHVVSSLKLEIVRALMGKALLFDTINESESALILSQLNSIVERYCGGIIENLRPLPDNKIDIRIKPKKGGESFSFDGLSSGQKEMIASLFLIWKNTREQPCIVLIDEPELHLNAEWHSDFIIQLHNLAPQNQYILATHSREIFRSVEPRHRAILVPDEDESGF